MQTNLIKSVQGCKDIAAHIQATRQGQSYDPFLIKETETNTKWVCRCIGNGNPWDCWIEKYGTNGSQSRTFKRLYVQPGKEDFKD